MAKKQENKFGQKLTGWSLVGLGALVFLINFTFSSTSEYVTHQTLYAIRSLSSIVIMGIGAMLLKD